MDMVWVETVFLWRRGRACPFWGYWRWAAFPSLPAVGMLLLSMLSTCNGYRCRATQPETQTVSNLCAVACHHCKTLMALYQWWSTGDEPQCPSLILA